MRGGSPARPAARPATLAAIVFLPEWGQRDGAPPAAEGTRPDPCAALPAAPTMSNSRLEWPISATAPGRVVAFRSLP